MARVYRSEAPEPSPFEIAPSERARQKRFQREQRESYDRRFRNPDPVEWLIFEDEEQPASIRLDQIVALWTWTNVFTLKDQPIAQTSALFFHRTDGYRWVLLGFRRFRLTKNRVRKWRRQCGIKKGDILHLVPITGRAPMYAPLYTKRPLPVKVPQRWASGAKRGDNAPTGHLRGKAGHLIDARRAKYAPLPRCSHLIQKGNDRSRCQYRAIWRVSYTLSGTATSKHPASNVL